MIDVAPDGSPVALYRALSGADEAELIASILPAGASVLELGCGAGRVTHELVARGFTVTGIDESAEMLAEVRGAETVQADITGLQLGRTFDAVILASHFVNDPDADVVRAFLATAARHLGPDGVVLTERYPLGWVATAGPSRSEREGVVVELHDLARSKQGVLHATVSYEVDGHRYDQEFDAAELDDEELLMAAMEVGLRLDHFADDACTWAVLAR